jgi:ABC-2 type transport system permease protein
MLWYKAWLETRWRFVIGLVLLALSACSTVLAYPEVLRLMPLVPQVGADTEIGRRIQEAAALSREYRGYVWSQWFRQNLVQTWTLFAVLLGTGGLLSQASGGGALFTLSLPASRARLLGVRAATGLAELLVLACVPSLLLIVLSPAVGESYSVVDVLIHGICLFMLVALCFAIALAVLEQFFRDLSRVGLFRVMTAEAYFRGDGLPWLGLITSTALSAALIYAATRNIARQDF